MSINITQDFGVAPQIAVTDVVDAAASGVRLIINNRPDGEDADAAQGAEIAAAAAAAGIGYVAIPVTSAGFSMPQIAATKAALAGADGPVLAYCRSGTRSTLLWALTMAHCGAAPDMLSEQAAAAGYSLGPVQATMAMLAVDAAGRADSDVAG